MTRRDTRWSPISILTVVVTTAWLASLVVRVIVPASAAAFASVDSGAVMVLGYYFVSRAVRKGGTSK